MKEIELKLGNLPKITNDIYIPLYKNKSRYLVLMGGGGSGKSVYACQKLLYRILTEKGHRILVCRKVARTMRESVFALIKGTISDWGMSELFTVNKTDMTIKCANGNEILFAGLDDVEKLKSIYDITSIWIEEASEIEPEDFRQLDIRLRTQTKNYKQIILTFNPVSITHWLKGEFFDVKKQECTTIHTTYKDNKFLTKDAITVLENFKQTDPYYYMVYCLGEWGITGKTVFNAQKLTERLNVIRNTNYPAGRFENKEGKIELIEDVNGDWTIFKKPSKDSYYVIGADVAEGLENGDYNAAHILLNDNTNCEQVAVYHGHIDPDKYAEELYKAGIYYNNALISVEINMEGGVVRNLERMGYTKLYMREQQDDITHQIQKKFGWRTTETSRRMIISDLIEYVRDYTYLINDVKTIDEMLTFVRNEKGKPAGQDGKHDDLVMAYAIALQAALSGQQQKASFEPQIDYDKLDKLPMDYQEDFWNMDKLRRIEFAKKHNCLK